ncbi:ureidoglycolate lyase [Orrella marina]|uniref:Ureidoglycolate lyase n=2 Tax=Orrella marina TaxID=2163011 RepID=A0A2R4XP76_9BURK|nr:ureidoglycolate lyase [Orrella marina]
MIELLGLGETALRQLGFVAAQADSRCFLDQSAWRIIAPLPNPGKIIGVGRNYGAHSQEGGMARQEEPRLFVKLSSSVIGPGEHIVSPASVHKLDWEVELAAVVGSVMRNMSVSECMQRVAGYTLLNDISAREFQFDVTPPQTTFAKSMDTFTPLGPCIVTCDEISDPGNLDLKCWVNDELVQDGSTSDMIFPVGYILSYISRFITLDPGDVIATGTPAGVGHFMKPPRYLQSGDRVRLFCPAIGELHNTVE